MGSRAGRVDVSPDLDGRIEGRGKREQPEARAKLCHSFVSLLSDSGIPIEEISRLVGHSSTAVTEQVYRHQIRPVVQDGVIAMDRLFGPSDEQLDDQP